MIKNGIIEKADDFCEWVNFIVTVEKKDPNKSLRICIDPKELNEAILNEQAYIPTFEEVASKLNGMKYFSVLDLKDGYWQVQLTKQSRNLCTFATPYGNFRFIRMPFGIKSAPSVFQRMNFDIFGDIENVIIYFDDILIVGKTRQEHDDTLKKVLERARANNVRFNERKTQIAVEQVKYLGHVFSLNEIKPDPDRLLAIEHLTRPKKKNDLQTFLGVVNFMRPFISNLSELTAPLRELLKKNVIFQWTALHDRVFNDIIQQILKSNILVPFDVNKELVVQCDASQSGLGCCLLQDNKPISFASRSLTDAECNYSQIEKEMLSIVFACNKFSFYTYGRPIKVVNDHKPLLGIMKKQIHKIASAKLQRMRLKLLNFDIILEHAPGKTIQLADYLSRYMVNNGEKGEDLTITEAILSINVSDERKQEIQRETENDELLREIKKFCKSGWPNHQSKCPAPLKYYYKLRNDILLDDDILFFGERVIIPKSMRKFMLDKLHEPHFGITKTRLRAQELVFWPCINNEIEQMISRCRICLENSSIKQKEPLIPHQIPDKPFHKLACDILEFKAKNYLVIVDYYSNWIELIRLKNKTAQEVNKVLLQTFASFGYPIIIIADNMPFGSYECREFARKHDFKFETSSPGYPQSNGLAERSVQVCKGILQKNETDEQIFRALIAYRNTPIKNMKYSPAQLLQNRILRTDIPCHENTTKPKLCCGVKEQHQHKQNAMKTHYDKTAKYRNALKENEHVVFRNNNKWQSGQIIKTHNTPRSYVIRSDDRDYRRNSRHIKHNAVSENENKNISEPVHFKVTRSGRQY